MKYQVQAQPNQLPIDVAVVFANEAQMLGPIEITEKMIKNGTITRFEAKNKKEVSYVVVGTKGTTESEFEIIGGFLAQNIKKDKYAFIRGEFSAEALRQLVIGLEMGVYAFDKYKKEKNEVLLEEVIFNQAIEGFEEIVEEARIVAESTNFARELVNEPANKLQPDSYEAIILDRYANDPRVEITIYKGRDLEDQQMNGLINVGKGSKHEPRLVSLRYNSAPEKEVIALVGKGVTFDSGGMNLKTYRYVGDMKTDMGGSAAMLGAFDILVQSNAAVNVICNLSICENIIDKDMVLASDIIDYPNGLTVEVGNTDAEGRLVLADALLLSQKMGAKHIIDAATLTGACVMALGDQIAGLFSNDQAMADALLVSGKANNEKFWQLPITEEYRQYLDSDHADVMNIALNAPGAGASTAALFLQLFIEEGTKWAHLDIAGTAYAKKMNYKTKATGFAVRTVANYVLEQSK